MPEGLAQWIEAAGVIATAAVAWWQIGELKRQQKGWNTLEICQKYSFDPVLDKALDALRLARNSGDLIKDPVKYRFEVVTILNYFEGIATGQEQLFYDAAIVKEHMEPIIRESVAESWKTHSFCEWVSIWSLTGISRASSRGGISGVTSTDAEKSRRMTAVKK